MFDRRAKLHAGCAIRRYRFCQGSVVKREVDKHRSRNSSATLGQPSGVQGTDGSMLDMAPTI
jgi:hypothetical protein